MAANSKPIVLDVNSKPAPQYFNPTTDAYEYLLGEAGAARSILWGPDGQALSVVARKLEVRATELEGRLGATTDAAQTNPAQAASQIALLKGLLTKLQDPATQTTLADIRDTSGIKKITDPVDVLDRAARLLGKVSADDGALATLGALANVAVTDPTQSASVIALLKGLLKTFVTDSGKVQLTGSKARIASAPVVGVKTVTSTVAEVFAGSSRKAGRSIMMIRNRSSSIRIRVGPSTVTDTTGFGIEPEAVLTVGFDPASDVAMYAVSEAGNVEVEVFEA